MIESRQHLDPHQYTTTNIRATQRKPESLRSIEDKYLNPWFVPNGDELMEIQDETGQLFTPHQDLSGHTNPQTTNTYRIYSFNPRMISLILLNLEP